MGKACLLILLLAICVTMSGCCCLTLSDSSYSPDSDYEDYGATPVIDDVSTDDYDVTALPTKPTPVKKITPTPVSTHTPTNTPTYVDYNNHIVLQSDLTASNNSIKETAEAMLANDKATFLQHMSKDTLQHVSGEPDLTSPQAVKLANGLKNARLTQAEPNMMTYQMTIDSTTYTFNTIKEDGTWKLTGL